MPVLRSSVEETVDGVGDFCRSVFDVFGRILGEKDVGVLFVEAVILGADVLLVVALQTFPEFDI